MRIVDFHFYENALLFQFKSYERLYCKKDGSPREVKNTLLTKVKNIMKKRYIQSTISRENFEINNNSTHLKILTMVFIQVD